MFRLDIHWGMAMAVMVLGMAADASAQQLFETDGIELHGEAQLVMSGGGTCNVLESDTAYDARRGNDGAPMDIWQSRFLGSQRVRPVARPPDRALSNRIGMAGLHQLGRTGRRRRSRKTSEWADSIGHIQESGRNVVGSPGQTLTETRFFIVLRGDPGRHDSRTGRWTSSSGRGTLRQQHPPPRSNRRRPQRSRRPCSGSRS